MGRDPAMANDLRMQFVVLMLALGTWVALLFAIMGRLALRALRRQPDFDAKSQMIWGARWFWAVVGGGCALASLIIIGVTAATPYKLTALAALHGLIYLPIVLPVYLLPWQAEGMAFRDAPRGWRRKRPFDLGLYLARLDRRLASRWHRLLMLLLLLYSVAWPLVALLRVYPLEADLLRWNLGDRIAAQVRQDLALAPAVEVIPIPLTDPGRWRLSVVFPAGTGGADGPALLAQVQASLARQHPSGTWELLVGVRHGRVLARGTYGSPGGPPRQRID